MGTAVFTLHGWLKQVYISLCHKRRREAAGPVPTIPLDPGSTRAGDSPGQTGTIRSIKDSPDVLYARYECAEKLKPVFAECMNHTG